MFKCIKCEELKNPSEFSPKKNAKRGHTDTCKICLRIYANRYYKNNKESRNKNSKKYRTKISKEFRDIKVEKGCKICGFNKSAFALEYHHIDPSTKLFSVSKKLTDVSKDKLQEEIKKCVLLCANCHRMVHSGEINLGS